MSFKPRRFFWRLKQHSAERYPDALVIPQSLVDRLWERAKPANRQECWEYLPAKPFTLFDGSKPNPKRYFRMSFRGPEGEFYAIKAHRLALLTRLDGPIPWGLLACHACGFSRCCNPWHLYAGTPEQNGADMMRHRAERENGVCPGGNVIPLRRIVCDEPAPRRRAA